MRPRLERCRRLERCSALGGDPKRKLGPCCSANFQHLLHALSTPHLLDPLATLGAQADRERELSEALRQARLELRLKERWHASELKHRGEVRVAQMEKAERERRKMGHREAALKEAQAALSSVEVRAPRTHEPVQKSKNQRMGKAVLSPPFRMGLSGFARFWLDLRVSWGVFEILVNRTYEANQPHRSVERRGRSHHALR